MGLIISDFYWIILTIDLKICEALIIKWLHSTTLELEMFGVFTKRTSGEQPLSRSFPNHPHCIEYCHGIMQRT